MDVRELKDKASQLFSKGKFGKAAETYESYCATERKDHQARLRCGDAWVKAGKKDRAITSYTAAAEGFARDGFLPRAIAASKLVLEIDPAHQGVQKMLAELYAQRSGGPGRPAPRSPAPAAPLHPSAQPAPVSPGASRTGPPQAAAAAPAAPLDARPPTVSRVEAIEIDVEEPAPAPTGIEIELADGGPVSGEVEIPIESGAGPEVVPVEVAPPQAERAPAPEVDAAAPSDAAPAEVAPSLPPGLRPRRTEQVDRGVVPPTPAVAPQVVSASPLGVGARASEAEPACLGELERSLQAFTRFDPDSLTSAAPPRTAAAASPSAFTELELEGDSLLHLVGAAAGAQAPATPSAEEAMEAPEEPSADVGALPKIPLFSDLPEDAFIALFERCPLKRYDAGQLVFEQGDEADAFYVICAGQTRVFRTDDGARRELATLEEGAFFGEMALLSDAARSASVEASVEDTQVLEISAEILRELSTRHPSVGTALKKFCRQRMLANVMNSAPLFRPFSRSDRRDLVQKFRAREVPRGEVLVREGQASDGLYLVLSGEVAVEAKGQVVATLREGQLFGEMSLLTRSPATATVRATRHTSVLRLPRQDFDLLILSHPQVLEHVAELTDERRQANAAAQLV